MAGQDELLFESLQAYICPVKGDICPEVNVGMKRSEMDRYPFDTEATIRNCQIGESAICGFAQKAIEFSAMKGSI